MVLGEKHGTNYLPCTIFLTIYSLSFSVNSLSQEEEHSI